VKRRETNARDKYSGSNGSDAFILTNPPRRSRSPVPRGTPSVRKINIPNVWGKEFRLTITIVFTEFRQPSQQAGSLYLQYLLGITTLNVDQPSPSPLGAGTVASELLENPSPKNNYFTIVTQGGVVIEYKGQASMHVWLSYYAEIPEMPS
jgi:hypothetical protein